MAILYTLYFILFTFLAWRRLDWAVLLAIFALPSYLVRFSLGPAPMTLLEAMIIILVIAWLIKRFSIRNFQFSIFNKFLISNFQFPLILFILTTAISIFVSPNLRAALGNWKAYFLEPILFFIVLKDLLNCKKEGGVKNGRPSEIDTKVIRYDQVIFALSLSALVLSAFAVYQHFTGFLIPHPWGGEVGRRVTSLFEYPNALALFLAPLAPLFVGQIFSRKKLLAIGYWLLVTLVSLLAIIYAHSTGALVGITAGLIFMTVAAVIARERRQGVNEAIPIKMRLPRFLWSLAMTIVFFIFLAAVFLFVFKNPSIKNELLLNDWSGQVRRQMWKETAAMLKDRPIFGAGLAGYQIAVAPYHKDKNIEIFLYPHNIFLNFWSETGLLGLVVFLLIIFNFFKFGFLKLFRNLKLEIRNLESSAKEKILLISIMASMVVILVHGLVDVPYFKNDLAILFWIIYAMII